VRRIREFQAAQRRMVAMSAEYPAPEHGEIRSRDGEKKMAGQRRIARSEPAHGRLAKPVGERRSPGLLACPRVVRPPHLRQRSVGAQIVDMPVTLSTGAVAVYPRPQPTGGKRAAGVDVIPAREVALTQRPYAQTTTFRQMQYKGVTT